MPDSHHYNIGAYHYQAPIIANGLYLVATPLGNLSDITIRALETLAGADIIACEDTRVSRVLLQRYAIKNRPVSYHEHNSNEMGPKLIEALKAGKSVALISDAGTPLISDPGFKLVKEAHAHAIKVVPIPGPSASLTALIASGLPTDQFLFAGFLPTRRTARQAKLREFTSINATIIFYESPHRVVDCLEDMISVFGDLRPAALARELTKKFETVDVQPLAGLLATYKNVGKIRGEIVLLVGASDSTDVLTDRDIDRLLAKLNGEMPVAKAAAEVARMTGLKKQNLYQRLLKLKS